MLLWLLENTLLALGLALLLQACSRLLVRRPALCHALWLVVLLRLLLPPVPSSLDLPSWTGASPAELVPRGAAPERRMSAKEAWYFPNTVRLRCALGGTWLWLVGNGGSEWQWIPSGPSHGSTPELRAYESSRDPDVEYRYAHVLGAPSWLRSAVSPEELEYIETGAEDAPRVARTEEIVEIEVLSEQPLHLWQGSLAPRGVRGIAGAMTDDLGYLSSRHLQQFAFGPLLEGLFWVFWTGLLLQLWGELRGIWRFRQRAARGFEASEEQRARLSALAARFGVTAPELRLVPGLPSPLLMKIRRARLLVPADRELTDMTLAHELSHLARRTPLRAWLEFVAGLVHWWNPVYWFVRSRVRHYGELACDAQVLAVLPEESGRYHETLAVSRQGLPVETLPTPVFGAIGGDLRSLEARRKALMTQSISARTGPVAHVLVTILLLFSFVPLLDARSAGQTAEQETSPTVQLLGTERAEALDRARNRHLAFLYWANRDWERAAKLYRDVQKTDPGYPESRHRLAVALLGTKQWQEAQPVLKEQLELGYATDRAHYNLAYAHMLAKQPEQAFLELERAADAGFPHLQFLREDPDMKPLQDAETGDPKRFGRIVSRIEEISELRTRVDEVLRVNDWRSALPLLQRAHELAPSSGRFLAFLAFACFQNDQYDAAERWFRKQLEMGYKPADAHVALGTIALARGNRELALDRIEKGLRTGFAEPKELMERREFVALRGDARFEELMAHALRFERLRAQTELWIEFRDWKGMHTGLAAQDLEELATDDQRAWVLRQLGEASLHLSDADAAEKYFRRVIDLARAPGIALYGLARVAALRKQDERALRLLELATLHGFDDPKALHSDRCLEAVRKDERFARICQLAADRMVLHRFAAPSWEYLREASSKRVLENPEAASAWHKKGWAHLRLGEHVEAREAFRRQDALGHVAHTARYNIACSYAMTGKNDEALEWLEKAIEAGFVDAKHIESDPDLAALRENPRYLELVARARELHKRMPPRPTQKEPWRKRR